MPAKNRLNFTKEALLRLPIPAAGQRVTYHDTKKRGLQLRITSTGVRTFSLYRWIKGAYKPERFTFGTFPDDWSVENARDKVDEIAGLIARGENPADALREKRSEMTLGELFEEYYSRHLEPNSKCPEDYRLLWERELGQLPDRPRKKHGCERHKPRGSVNWQNRKLSSITPDEVSRMMRSIGARSKSAANQAYGVLSAMYNKAKVWKFYRGQHPCEGIPKYRLKTRDRFLRQDEMKRFFEAIAADTNETGRDYILLAIMTGARRTNVLSMRWQDVDLISGTWHLPDTKNGEPQHIPLMPMAVAILKNRKQRNQAIGSEYVFPGRGGKGHQKEVVRAWKRIMAVSQIPNLRKHDLRRTLGSWQASTGSSLVVIGKTLNHKDPSSTRIYARLDIDPVRDSIATATNAMFFAAGLLKKAPVTDIRKASAKRRARRAA